MAEEGGDKTYKLITEEGKEQTTSRHYNGKATVQYENGDIYEG